MILRKSDIPSIRSCVFWLVLLLLILGPSAAAQSQQTPSPPSRPVIFVHGICGDADSWLALRQALILRLQAQDITDQNIPPLYPSGGNFDVFYDGQSVKLFSSGTDLLLSNVQPDARFFTIKFYSPVDAGSPLGHFDPAKVAEVSIFDKANELSQVIKAVTTLTHIKDVVVIAHSMGGLVARTYVEGLVAPGYAEDIGEIVTVDTPHGGALITPESLLVVFPSCQFGTSVNKAEMTPGGNFMANLNNQVNVARIPASLPIYSIKSYYDVPGFSRSDNILYDYEQSMAQNVYPIGSSVFPDIENSFGIAEGASPSLFALVTLTGLEMTSCPGLSGLAIFLKALHLLECVGSQQKTKDRVGDLVTLAKQGQLTSMRVQATLDNAAWTGAVSYRLDSADGTTHITGTNVPFTSYDVPVGNYILSYSGGGPSSSVVLLPSGQFLGFDLTAGTNNWNPSFTLAFTTQVPAFPTVTTLGASGLAGDGAILSANINPNGAVATEWFEWGTSSTLQSFAATPQQQLTSGTTLIPVTYGLAGLQSNTTYYYRAAASNSAGTVRGLVQSFTTLATMPAPTLLAPANGATGISDPPSFSWSTVTGATSYRLIVATNLGALPKDATSATCGTGCVLNVTPGTANYVPSPGMLAPGVTYYWEVHARSPLQFGDWSATFSFSNVPPALSGLTLTPSTLVSGTQTTLTVALNGPAPSGGAFVSLSSSNPAAFPVPSSITVSAGYASASISLPTGTVTTSISVTVAASYNSSSASSTLTVTPSSNSVFLNSLAVSPASIAGGFSSLGILTLTGSAPESGATVLLSSNNTRFVQVPPTVTVTPGYINVAFLVTTFFTSSNVGATITASYNGTMYGASITVLPVGISGLTFYPSSVTAGNDASFNVYLTGPAPAGASISLVSSNPTVLQVPSTVPVATGAVQATVSGTTVAVSTQSIVTVTASFNLSSGSGSVTVVPAPPLTVNTLNFSPATITGGGPASGRVTLTGVAPNGGVNVAFSSSSGLVQAPATVLIPAGAWYADFTASTSSVSSVTSVTVTASYGGVSQSTVLYLVPPLPFLASLSLNPTTVAGGTPCTGTVTLTAPAPLGGVFVNLNSSFHAVTSIGNGVFVPADATRATFTISSSLISFIYNVTITASYNGTTQRALLTIVPPGTPLAPSSIALSPASVTGGSSSIGTISLTGPAPVGGAVLSLSSDNPAVQVPLAATVPVGGSNITFTVTTAQVPAITTATITATYNGTSQSSLLTVKPSVQPTLVNRVPFLASPLIPISRIPSATSLPLTVSGSGFVPGAQIFWNDTTVPTTFVNSSQLQGTVPATDVQLNGSAVVTVRNPGAGTPPSNGLPVHLTYPTAAPSFTDAPLSISGTAYAVATADLNRDGNIDLVVGKSDGSGLSVYLGNGDGTFGPELRLPTIASTAVVVADFNGDGKQDIAFNKSFASGLIGMLSGNGDGTFTPMPDIALPSSTGSNSSLAVGDFNGDGALDLVVTGQSLTQAYVLLGNGDGTFRAPTGFGSVNQPMSVAVDDFNGDGKLDIALTDFVNQAVAILLGNGDGTFQGQIEYPANGYPYALSVADLNGDGHPDITIAEAGPCCGTGSGAGIILSNGNGTFSPPVNYGAGRFFYFIATDDVDGDGLLDLVVAQGTPSPGTLMFHGNGDGTFSAAPITLSATGTLPVSLAVADIDSDGAPDILTPTNSSGTLPILMQSIGPILHITPLALSFNATQGGNSPSPVALSIFNTGGGTASWSAAATDPWLTLSQSQGTAPDSIVVAINPSGLNAGTYNAALTIAATGASNSPQTVNITLTIDPLPVVVSSLSFRPSAVAGPATATGNVTLSSAAPSGGATVTLSSDNPAVQVPSTLTISAGLTSASFSATASAVTAQVIATVTATTYNGVSTTATLTVDPGSPTVAVLSPNGGEKLFTGTPYTVTWSASDPGALSFFDVFYSTNGGSTYSNAVPGCSGVSGAARSCVWASPGPTTTAGRIKVTAHDASGNTASDASNANYSVVSGTGSITVTQPNTTLNWVIGTSQQIKWNHNLGLNSFVMIELSRDAGASWEVITPSFKNTGATASVFNWVVAGRATTQARVRVTWLNGPVSDISNVNFNIVNPSATVTQPNTAANWGIGSTQQIKWNHNVGLAATFTIEVSRDGGLNYSETITTSAPATTATTGVYNWTVTDPASTTARVRVTWNANPVGTDTSNVNFTIANPFITVAAPNSTTANWGYGTTQKVTWNTNLGPGDRVNVLMSTDGGVTFPTTLASNIIASVKSATFTTLTLGAATTQARVRVEWVANTAIASKNPANFKVQPPFITVSKPNLSTDVWTIGTSQTITFTQNLGSLENVMIELSLDGGTSYSVVLFASTTSTGSKTVTVQFGWVTQQGRVRITWLKNGSITDTSNQDFPIQ